MQDTLSNATDKIGLIKVSRRLPTRVICYHVTRQNVTDGVRLAQLR